jgi:hypothetical protein
MSRGTIRTHAGPIRIASSIRADMIFGKDRGDHADVRPRRFGRIGTSRRHAARACRRRSAERGRAVRLLRFIPVVVAILLRSGRRAGQRPRTNAAMRSAAVFLCRPRAVAAIRERISRILPSPGAAIVPRHRFFHARSNAGRVLGLPSATRIVRTSARRLKCLKVTATLSTSIE